MSVRLECGFLRWHSLLILASLLPLRAATQPASAREIFEQGQQELSRGDLIAAGKDFRQVLAAEPNNAGAHGNLAVVYMRRREWRLALTELRAAEHLAPKIPGIRLNIGLVYYRQADYRQAIGPFESVLRDEESRQARYLLGLCYFFTERYADAAAALQPLWPQESENLNYLYVVSIAANQAGRVELERAARIDPKLPFVHYFLGSVYRRRNNLEAAKQEFLKDAAIEPDVVYDYDQLGLICYTLGQIPEAERYFKQALRLDASLGTSDFGLAKIYKQQGKYAEALNALHAAGAIDAQSASVHYLRGQVLTAMGRRAEAKPEFDEAARLQKATRDELERKISGRQVSDPQLAREDR